jgi:hypothetical protein
MVQYPTVYYCLSTDVPRAGLLEIIIRDKDFEDVTYLVRLVPPKD